MSLLDQLSQVVASQVAPQTARQTGLDQGLAEKMLPMAMSALMAGIKKNASSPEGANALAQALDKHDGSLLNDIDKVASPDVLADGQNILAHILGGKRETTERALAKAGGIDQAQMSQLMAMAAPMVLGALGRAKREQGLDASALAGMVTEESVRAQKQAPEGLGGLMGFLDQDGDGDFKDELMEMAGKQIFGGLFGKRG